MERYHTKAINTRGAVESPNGLDWPPNLAFSLTCKRANTRGRHQQHFINHKMNTRCFTPTCFERDYIKRSKSASTSTSSRRVVASKKGPSDKFSEKSRDLEISRSSSRSRDFICELELLSRVNQISVLVIVRELFWNSVIFLGAMTLRHARIDVARRSRCAPAEKFDSGMISRRSSQAGPKYLF
jgi:hypothetical protein